MFLVPVIGSHLMTIQPVTVVSQYAGVRSTWCVGDKHIGIGNVDSCQEADNSYSLLIDMI